MVYRVAKQRDKEAKDVQQIRLMEDAEDKVLTIEEEVLQRWKDYLGGLMNVENPREMRGKWGEGRSERMSGEWRRAICKNKGDAQNCANCRGIKLMSHIRKLWEKGDTHKSKELLQKFDTPGRSTTDAIFVLRMLMEKYRERQRQPGCMFLELKKRYDKVPREDLWHCMQESSIPEVFLTCPSLCHSLFCFFRARLRVNLNIRISATSILASCNFVTGTVSIPCNIAGLTHIL
ncbi:uncharacterized protein LOC119576030 [Penaeus monodon]|uniref:uncharacterized protein LOC119576030 n=1 Tax=Penaeus monodon TaxID=6687 RepID=UPI0018A71C8F|nr:uncharacterized protein LOC119576030 [Penaeus monodon]